MLLTDLRDSTILLVDDDAIVTMVCRKVFQQYAAKITFASFSSGEAGLDSLRNNQTPPDLILLDINMEEIDGWRFLDEMQKMNITCGVIMFTSSIDQHDIEKSKGYSMVKDFIVKPLNEKKLATILDYLKV
jgi:CheY-like chemotaxis protein